jgi:hypothetical protein
VLQIVLGITIGPQVPDWAHADAPVRVLALLGLAFPASAVRYGVTGVRHLWLAWL